MRRIRMLISVLTAFLVSLAIVGMLVGPALAWIGDAQLREIDRRIEEIESRLLQLDKDQLLNRSDWVGWAIDILQNDIKKMEEEIREKRKEWEELRNSNLSSEEAWREWERVGRELDELDRKKSRLDSTLARLKGLRDRIEQRIKETKRIYEPKPFALGLGLGSLSFENRSVQVFELKLRTPIVDLFYGSNGYEETEKVQISYVGVEKAIVNFQFPNGALRIPVGILSFQDGITPCVGVMGELRYQTADSGFSTLFAQIRYGFGQDSIVGFFIGLFL